MRGTISGADKNGRFITYDLSQGPLEPLAERIQKQVPAGLTLKETVALLREKEARFKESIRMNSVIMYSCGSFLLLLVAIRVLLLWDRARRRNRLVRQESPYGTSS